MDSRVEQTDPLDATLKAMADGNRRSILALVRERPLAVGEIANGVEMSQQAVSHHLRVLRKAGLVSEARDGARHIFAVRTEGFSTVQQYVEDFWPRHLSALKAAAERAAQEHRG